MRSLRSPPETRWEASGSASRRVQRPRYWGLLTMKGTHPIDEPPKAKKRFMPSPYKGKGPKGAFQLPVLGRRIVNDLRINLKSRVYYRIGLAREAFGGRRAGAPTGVRALLGMGSGGVASLTTGYPLGCLRHQEVSGIILGCLRHAGLSRRPGLSPATSWAVSGMRGCLWHRRPTCLAATLLGAFDRARDSPRG